MKHRALIMGLFLGLCSVSQAQHPGAMAGPSVHTSLTKAEEDTSLPVGTIAVKVVDAQGVALPQADVELGTLNSEGTRDKRRKQTDASGQTVFDRLPGGNTQAYRINVPYQGALFSSSPFQLPMTHGYSVVVQRLEVTESEQTLVQSLGQFLVEFKDDRMHISQQARLVNLGDRAVVWPSDGLEVTLPKNFTALNFEKVMTDQRFEPTARGFKIKGSLAPGEVVLTWAFDLPIEGSDMKFDLPVVWRTFRYRALVEAPEGLDVALTGLPAPTLYDEDDHRVYASLVQRSPSDAPLESVGVTLRNIPGPGPARWVALFCVVLILGAALVYSLYGPVSSPVSATEAERLKLRLAKHIAEIDADPHDHPEKVEYRAHLLRQLAILFREK